MLSKKDLARIKSMFKAELYIKGESSDYKRGLRMAAILIHDVLREKGKNDTAEAFVGGIG